MAAKKTKYDPAAALLENVIKRRHYSSETHEAVTNFLTRYAADENQALKTQNTLLRREVEALKQRLRRTSNDY